MRRPPKLNEQYRLDRMLQAAAARGVRINVIVYKEVTQALSRKFLTFMSTCISSLIPVSSSPALDALSTLATGSAPFVFSWLER